MNAIVISGMDNLVSVAGVAKTDVAVGAAAVTLGELNGRTRKVLITVEDGDVFVTFNGSAPSSSNGSLFLRQTVLVLARAQALKLRALRATSTSGRLHVEECVFANGARG